MCVLVEIVCFYRFQKNSQSVLLQACKIFYFYFGQENHRASCSRRVSFVVINNNNNNDKTLFILESFWAEINFSSDGLGGNNLVIYFIYKGLLDQLTCVSTGKG